MIVEHHLPESDTLALRDVVSRICADLCTNSVEAPDLWGALIALIQPTIQNCARSYAQKRSPVSRVPDELLCSIFAQLDLQDRIATSHVCHAWREVSLQNVAQIWNRIPRLRGCRGLGPLLRRAKDCPVSVELCVTDLNVDFIVGMLIPHMAHIRGLTLELSFNPNPILHLLRRPAPVLEHLALISSRSDEPGPAIFTASTFSGKAPRLRTVIIEGLHCNFKGPPQTLNNVRSFSYLIEDEICSASVLPVILKSCQEAEEIIVKAHGWECATLKPYKPSVNLRRLDIRCLYGTPSFLLDQLVHDSIHEIRVDCPEQFEDLWTSLRLRGPVTAEIHCDTASDMKIYDHKRGVVRILYSIRSGFASCPASLVTCITSLVLSTSGYDWGYETRSPLPELQCLRRLTLITRPNDNMTRYLPPGETLLCKALEIMTICPSELRMVLPTANTIIQFMHTYLRTGRETIQEIVLVLPDNDSTSMEYSDSLCRVTDLVTFSPESLHNIPLDVQWSFS